VGLPSLEGALLVNINETVVSSLGMSEMLEMLHSRERPLVLTFEMIITDAMQKHMKKHEAKMKKQSAVRRRTIKIPSKVRIALSKSDSGDESPMMDQDEDLSRFGPQSPPPPLIPGQQPSSQPSSQRSSQHSKQHNMDHFEIDPIEYYKGSRIEAKDEHLKSSKPWHVMKSGVDHRREEKRRDSLQSAQKMLKLVWGVEHELKNLNNTSSYDDRASGESSTSPSSIGSGRSGSGDYQSFYMNSSIDGIVSKDEGEHSNMKSAAKAAFFSVAAGAAKSHERHPDSPLSPQFDLQNDSVVSSTSTEFQPMNFSQPLVIPPPLPNTKHHVNVKDHHSHLPMMEPDSPVVLRLSLATPTANDADLLHSNFDRALTNRTATSATSGGGVTSDVVVTSRGSGVTSGDDGGLFRRSSDLEKRVVMKKHRDSMILLLQKADDDMVRR
jgi:hypothetical protein